jgi:hypothetical protein
MQAKANGGLTAHAGEIVTRNTVGLQGAEARTLAGELGVTITSAVGSDTATPRLTPVTVDHGMGIETLSAVSTDQPRDNGGSFRIGGGEAPIERPIPRESTFKINGGEPTLSVTRATSRLTIVIRAVRSNKLGTSLTALSLLAELERTIESLRATGSNSEIAELADLKRRVEKFLADNEKSDETATAESAISIADQLRPLWQARRDDLTTVGLFGTGLAFCAAAGALGVSDTNILAVAALVNGDKVGSVLNAAANLVWGKGKSKEN